MKPPRPRLKLPGLLSETVRTIIFVVAVTILFDLGVPRSLVEGRSMQPTFYNGDRLIVSRVHYLIDSPERGDIIVFNSLNPNEPGVMLIKRVVGLPGDHIALRDGQVYINGELLEETYTLSECTGFSCQDADWQLGPDEYFVMGDNRNNSQDSRRFGAVKRSDIVGLVLFRYWPLTTAGVINGRDDVD